MAEIIKLLLAHCTSRKKGKVVSHDYTFMNKAGLSAGLRVNYSTLNTVFPCPRIMNKM